MHVNDIAGLQHIASRYFLKSLSVHNAMRYLEAAQACNIDSLNQVHAACRLGLRRHRQIGANTLCVCPYAHVRMRALKGLACRARVTPASSHASPCSGEALMLPACYACGCASLFAHAFGPCYMEKTYVIAVTVYVHALKERRDDIGGLTSRVRHSVALYGQLLLFCDQSMREKAWRSRKRGA